MRSPEPENALGHILYDPLELGPVVREMLTRRGRQCLVVIEKHLDLPDGGIRGHVTDIIVTAVIICDHPLEHMRLRKILLQIRELVAVDAAHEVIIPHVAVVPRQEFLFEVEPDLEALSLRRTQDHFELHDIIV